jgi:hypothetical protein
MVGWLASAVGAGLAGWWAILGYPHPLITHGLRRLREVKAADPVLRRALEGDATRPHDAGVASVG